MPAADYLGRKAGRWDLDEFARYSQAGSVSASLSPTAALSACWIGGFYGGNQFWVRDFWFSTDTAIQIFIGIYSSNLAIPAVNIANLGTGNNGVNGLGASAGLLAPPARSVLYFTALVPAGFCGTVGRGLRISTNYNQGIGIVTAAVAANCAASFTMINAGT